MTEKAALAMVRDVDEIYAAKGKKLVHLDLRANPPRSEIIAAIIGPSGNLRAPTVRKGKTLLVGFTEDLYRHLIRSR